MVEREAAGRAWVITEDAGDDGGELELVEADVVGVQVERRGSPERTPSPGDSLRAGAVLGWEEVDDAP